MCPKLARCTSTPLPGTERDALPPLHEDGVMRHFPLNPPTTPEGRAELTSRVCAQQALDGILQAIREQAGWPARAPGDEHDGCDDSVACHRPSLAKD